MIDKEIKITIGYDSSTGNDVITNEAGAVKYTGKEDYSMINTISFKAHCIREYTDKKTGQKKTKQVNVKPSARYRVCVGDCNDGLYCWPTTGRISQGPFSSFSHKNYDAVDIADNNGNGIYAPFDGSYCYKWNSGKSAPTCQNLNGRTVCTNGGVGYGCYAYATDSVNGGTYVFGHMNRSVCEKMLGSAGGSHCQKFEKGQRIGTVDHTGLSSGAHLHFGFREKKSPTSGVTKLEELFNNNQKVKVNSRISDDCSKYCTGSNCNPQGF